MTDIAPPSDDRFFAAETTPSPAFSGLDLLREDYARRSALPPAQAARSDAVQVAQSEPPTRVFTISPTDLIPHQVLDIEATFNSQMGIRRALRNLSPSEAAGINPDIMSADSIRNLASTIHRVADRLAPGQPPLSLSAGLEPFANHAARAFDDPARQRIEIGVQLELMRRSLNQQLQASGSPISFGPMQVAVDENGRQFHALPVMHNGVHTNMLRFSPLLSEAEIRERNANRPRLV